MDGKRKIEREKEGKRGEKKEIDKKRKQVGQR